MKMMMVITKTMLILMITISSIIITIIIIIILIIIAVNVFVRMLALKVHARTTLLVKAVLPTKAIDVCVLRDSGVRHVTKVLIKVSL